MMLVFVVSPILFFANSILMPPRSDENRTYPCSAFIEFAAYRTSFPWPSVRVDIREIRTHRVFDKRHRSSSLIVHPETTESRKAAHKWTSDVTRPCASAYLLKASFNSCSETNCPRFATNRVEHGGVEVVDDEPEPAGLLIVELAVTMCCGWICACIACITAAWLIGTDSCCGTNERGTSGRSEGSRALTHRQLERRVVYGPELECRGYGNLCIGKAMVRPAVTGLQERAQIHCNDPRVRGRNGTGFGRKAVMCSDCVRDSVYLRPVSGWTASAGCVAAAGGDDCCFGLLTLVLLFANSSRMVCGRSGSKRTPPCCRSCFADSAPARVENVTNPTGDEVFPFLEVTFRSEPSYPCNIVSASES